VDWNRCQIIVDLSLRTKLSLNILLLFVVEMRTPMVKNEEAARRYAIERYLEGQSVEVICAEFQQSRSWFFKWQGRYDTGEPDWFETQSRAHRDHPRRVSTEVEAAVKLVRLSLYNRGLFCGAQAIQWELKDLSVTPVPSLRTINRILDRQGLTHRRTGRYEPSGKVYPALDAGRANQVHESDFVGPC
jgi:putative transposase